MIYCLTVLNREGFFSLFLLSSMSVHKSVCCRMCQWDGVMNGRAAGAHWAHSGRARSVGGMIHLYVCAAATEERREETTAFDFKRITVSSS